MRIDCKDKELWGNVLVTIEWLVTFIFLIFDRGEKILVDGPCHKFCVNGRD